MNYFNYYINENIFNIYSKSNDDNHSKVIDYILLLKLIMHNKGFYFPNNFYENCICLTTFYIEKII